MKNALKVNDRDNVATVFEAIKKGIHLGITDHLGNQFVLFAENDIPYGHKIALQNMEKGTPVIKYGQIIGMASRKIYQGEHVHIHNMESCRGRGDLEGGRIWNFGDMSEKTEP